MMSKSSLTHTSIYPKSNIRNAYGGIKNVKYPINAIEPAQQLKNKILSFKNQKLIKQMKQKFIQERQLNAYRKIRGDGNCFFRALAYAYLVNVKKLERLQETFQMLNEINLTQCYKQSIPKDFKPFYENNILKEVLRQYWESQIKYMNFYCNNNKKRLLSKLLRRRPYLDFIIILYFRSLCLKGLQIYKNSPDFKNFIQGTQQQKIRTYSQQSQGVVLDICNKFMKVDIQVFEVRKQELKIYSYKKKANRNSIQVSLLYYQNHYDIIQQIQPQLLNEQKFDVQKQKVDFYTQNSEQMMIGKCIQCQNEGYIYVQNGLCLRCFQISKSTLQNFQKDKFVTGKCNQCLDITKISQMFHLCKECIEYQNKIQSMAKMKKQKKYCIKCQNQLKQNNLSSVYCSKCLKQNEANKQGYCPKCTSKYSSNYHKEYCSKMCSTCRQSITSQYHQLKCINKLTNGKIFKAQDLNSNQSILREKQRQIEKQKQFKQNQRQTLKKYQYNNYKLCKSCGKNKYNYQLQEGVCNQCRFPKKQKEMFSSKLLIQCVKCRQNIYTEKSTQGLCDACRIKR